MVGISQEVARRLACEIDYGSSASPAFFRYCLPTTAGLAFGEAAIQPGR
jgi:hypothetical protein